MRQKAPPAFPFIKRSWAWSVQTTRTCLVLESGQHFRFCVIVAAGIIKKLSLILKSKRFGLFWIHLDKKIWYYFTFAICLTQNPPFWKAARSQIINQRRKKFEFVSFFLKYVWEHSKSILIETNSKKYFRLCHFSAHRSRFTWEQVKFQRKSTCNFFKSIFWFKNTL